MREIKFRAYAVEKLTSETQWLEGWGVTSIEYSEKYAKEIGRSEDWYLYTDGGAYWVHKESIVQYTGLKDKNGREIYERDVVKYKRIFFTDCSRTEIEREGEEIVGEFYYIDDIIPALRTSSEGHFRVFDSSFPKLELFDCEQDFEIIGNIYENPELLEGK